MKYDCFKDAGGFLSSFVMSRFSLLPSSPTESISNMKSYLKTFDKDQVEGYQYDNKAKTITVIHNPLLITAEELKSSMLEKTGIKTEIEEDGNDGKEWKFTAVKDELSAEEEEAADGESSSSGIRPGVVVCGIFWIVSMLSNIGGSW